MNSAEELCHSSGPWKKHKYFQKIGEGANAVYKYAKNADKTITGSAYKKEAKDEEERAEYANELAGHAPKAIMVGRDVDNVKNDGSADFAFKSPDQWADSASYHGRKAAEAESNYYNKSLFGKAEKTARSSVARGQRLIESILHPKETVSVTSNLMPAGTKKTIKK